MNTKIKSVHEEQYSDGSKTLGILYNYSDEDNNWHDSFPFIFNNERKTYIFFTTMVDMFDFLLYGEDKMKRAYMTEKVFDEIYDKEISDRKFSEYLTWI